MADDNRQRNRTRRDLLRTAAGAGAVTLVAGCSGETPDGQGGSDGSGGGNGSEGNSEGTESGSGGGGSDSYDNQFVLPHFKNMAEIQFNRWNPAQNTGFERFYLFDKFTQYLPQTQEYDPVLMTDWSRDGDTVTLNMREGMQWHSGQDLTADHVVNHLELSELFGQSMWDFISEVQAADETTVEATLDSKTVNTSILFDSLLTMEVYTHPELHKEFIDRLADASGDSARESIKTDLVEFTIGPEEAMETVGNGPMKITDYNNQEVTLQPHDGYPVGWSEGNDLNFELKSRNFGEGTDVIYRAAASDRCDVYRGGIPTKLQEQLKDHWEYVPFPTSGGQAIFFSPKSLFGKDEERSRKVRQAIAYAYDPSEWSKVYGEKKSHVPSFNNVTGLSHALDEQWLSDIGDSLTNYGDADSGWSQMEKANSLMQEAGFERNGNDMWVDSETGKVLEAPVQFPGAWSDGLPGYRNAAEQLSEFGIRSEASGKEVTSFLGSTLPNDDYQLAMVSYGGGPHPYSAYRMTLGSIDDTKWRERNGLNELTVPWPVGNPDGDLKTVNVEERVKELAVTTDEAKEQRLVEELAWTVNQWVPFVESETRNRSMGISTDNWQYDIERDSPKFHSDHVWAYMTRLGNLSPK